MTIPTLLSRSAGYSGCSHAAASFSGRTHAPFVAAPRTAASLSGAAACTASSGRVSHLVVASGSSLAALGNRSSAQNVSRRSRCAVRPQAAADDGDSKPQKNTEFGYSRKDILLLGAGLIGVGYALYYGLQAFGVEPAQAGNAVQITIFLGICVGYISTYVFRVANKDMTYVKQLEDYEEAVMARRLAEMPPEEVDRLMAEVETETAERAQRKQRILEAAQQQRDEQK